MTTTAYCLCGHAFSIHENDGGACSVVDPATGDRWAQPCLCDRYEWAGDM